MSIRICSAVAALVMLSACQQGSTPAVPTAASPETAPVSTAETAPDPAPGERRPSRAQWTGKSSGSLDFDTADCTKLNGRIIHFVSPAGGRHEFPRIDGSEAQPGAWAFNIVPGGPDDPAYSGGGKPTAEGEAGISLAGTMLDGPSNATGAAIATVEGQVQIACTKIVDLGHF